jgi:hypothetical protein
MPVDVLPAEVPILDVEPDVGIWVAGAFHLALSKGYLEREDVNKPSASHFAHLQTQNYSIEDKTYIYELAGKRVTTAAVACMQTHTYKNENSR